MDFDLTITAYTIMSRYKKNHTFDRGSRQNGIIADSSILFFCTK